MGRIANLKWKVEINTTPPSTATFVEVKGLESVDWDNSEEVQEGYFLSDGGAGYANVTAGRLNISVSGKRVDGDAGQDYIVGLVGSWGSDRESTVQLTNSENSDMYTIPCAIEIGTFSGGAAEELESFECVFHSDGAWTVSA